MNDSIQAEIDFTNEILENSMIDLRINLVETPLVSDTPTYTSRTSPFSWNQEITVQFGSSGYVVLRLRDCA